MTWRCGLSRKSDDVLCTAVTAPLFAPSRTRENPEGFGILSPFRLPYEAKRVKLQPAKVILEF